MKINCAICGKSKEYPNTSTQREIEADKIFTIWGYNEDKTPYSICLNCVEGDGKSETKEEPKKKKEDESDIKIKREKKYIITSGLHLGNPKCDRNNILKLINNDYDKLIINGVFDSVHHKSINGMDDYIIQRLEEEQKNNKLILVKGADEYWIQDLSYYSKLIFTEDYTWDYFSYKFHATSNQKLGNDDIILDRVVKFGKEKDYSAIFIGDSAPIVQKKNDIVYCNTGNFIPTIGNICYWVELNGEDNVIRLKDSFYHKLSGTYTYSKSKKKESQEVIVPPVFIIPRENGRQVMELA